MRFTIAKPKSYMSGDDLFYSRPRSAENEAPPYRTSPINRHKKNTHRFR